MYVQLSIDNVIGTGLLAGEAMSHERYVAFKDMARALVEEFASANGWVDTAVEEHESYDGWSGLTSTKIAAYATEASDRRSGFSIRDAVATLAWQFSQESIHLVVQSADTFTWTRLVYASEAPEANRRESYSDSIGGAWPWQGEDDEDVDESVDSDHLDRLQRIETRLERVVEFVRERIPNEPGSWVDDPDLAAILDEADEPEPPFAEWADSWGRPEPDSIKVDGETVRKARDIVTKVLGHPDADEATLDIFGRVLRLPADLSDGFTIVRSTTD